ncbi:HEPN domain-containing protein [Synechococcus sp. BDU 130192]|uniref:HEPN domain-containing protein n=1 Tax=Synechococcus sp. BDU 130192 TaxID=2042059 RepID=UPI000C077A1B|nr:HEPN domain-containing protein [Synechococcus sp. BDU 130192]
MQYKKQSQEAIDFIYLCCYAIPSLNAYMKAVEKGCAEKIPDADYFKSIPSYSRLQEIKKNYKKVLGDSLTISIFSYFESYVFNVIDEVLDFHQKSLGKDLLDFTNERRNKSFELESSDEQLKKKLKKLRTEPKKSNEQAYQKAIDHLRTTPYLLPSQLFSSFGVKQLKSVKKSFTAKDIPIILEDIFGLAMSSEEQKNFEDIKQLRNNIAHGDVQAIDLKKAIQHTKFLKKLATKYDAHVCKFFFVIEKE